VPSAVDLSTGLKTGSSEKNIGKKKDNFINLCQMIDK